MKHIFAICAALAAAPASADAPIIETITAQNAGQGWSFSVTLRHADTGWDDYADGWRIETEDGTILGTRILAHPHVNEQPFTRSLGNIEIPAQLTSVYVRASDSVGGWADETTPFELD